MEALNCLSGQTRNPKGLRTNLSPNELSLAMSLLTLSHLFCYSFIDYVSLARPTLEKLLSAITYYSDSLYFHRDHGPIQNSSP